MKSTGLVHALIVMLSLGGVHSLLGDSYLKPHTAKIPGTDLNVQGFVDARNGTSVPKAAISLLPNGVSNRDLILLIRDGNAFPLIKSHDRNQILKPGDRLYAGSDAEQLYAQITANPGLAKNNTALEKIIPLSRTFVEHPRMTETVPQSAIALPPTMKRSTPLKASEENLALTNYDLTGFVCAIMIVVMLGLLRLLLKRRLK